MAVHRPAGQHDERDLDGERGKEQIKQNLWTLGWFCRPHIFPGNLWPPGSAAPAPVVRVGVTATLTWENSSKDSAGGLGHAEREGEAVEWGLGKAPGPHKPQGVRLGLSGDL